MNKAHIMIVLTFIMLFGLLYISIRLGVPQKIINSASESIINFNNDERPKKPEGFQWNGPSDRDQEGAIDEENGGTGEESESNGESSASSTSTCKDLAVSFSLDLFNSTSICETYEGQICTEKTVTCSMNIRNLDDLISGDFQAIFTFKDSESGDLINVNSQTQTLLPREVKSYSSTLHFTGLDAEREIKCSFGSGLIPIKEKCDSQQLTP